MSSKVVLYYADWCPHCHNFMPEWNKLSKMLNNKGIKTEQYDYAKNPSPADKENVGGFPTVKLFSADGRSTELDRGTANEMFNKIKTMTNYKYSNYSNYIKGNSGPTEHFSNGKLRNNTDDMLNKINEIIRTAPFSTMENNGYSEQFDLAKQAGGMFSGYNPAYSGLVRPQYTENESSYLASPQQFLNYKYNMYMKKYNLM